MSYVYKLKNADKEKLAELGFEKLPEELCPAPQNENYLFKVVMQPADGECVKTLISYYNKGANQIVKNKELKEAYASIGIKFRSSKNKPRHLVITPELIEMFQGWRIEINLETEEVYFTIADGSLPRFYDAELVLEKYCPEEIKELIINDLIQKEEVTQVQ